MNQRNEQISALMDDELNAQEQEQAIDFLTESQMARRVWSEYHIIRDYLQQSAEMSPTPKPSSKIRQWLKLPVLNDERWTAGIAASLAVVSFMMIMLVNGGNHTPNEMAVMPTPQAETTIENPALASASPDNDSTLPMSRDEYYLRAYHQSVDMDGLKQVSYSFE